MDLKGKKVIALGERDGVQGGSIVECVKSAGAEVVIEEFLEGEEASFIVITDGTNVLPLSASSSDIATMTPLPAASPSALMTIGEPCSRRYARAGSVSVKCR